MDELINWLLGGAIILTMAGFGFWWLSILGGSK
jgi:hypothetical protein